MDQVQVEVIRSEGLERLLEGLGGSVVVGVPSVSRANE